MVVWEQVGIFISYFVLQFQAAKFKNLFWFMIVFILAFIIFVVYSIILKRLLKTLYKITFLKKKNVFE